MPALDRKAFWHTDADEPTPLSAAGTAHRNLVVGSGAPVRDPDPPVRPRPEAVGQLLSSGASAAVATGSDSCGDPEPEAKRSSSGGARPIDEAVRPADGSASDAETRTGGDRLRSLCAVTQRYHTERRSENDNAPLLSDRDRLLALALLAVAAVALAAIVFAIVG